MSSKLAGLNIRNNLKANIKLDDKGGVKTDNKKIISFKDSLFTKVSLSIIFRLMHDEVIEVIPPDVLFFGKNYQLLRSLLIIRKMTIYTICSLDQEAINRIGKYSDEDWSSFSKLQMHLKNYYNIK
jgi:hypothetical protein